MNVPGTPQPVKPGKPNLFARVGAQINHAVVSLISPKPPKQGQDGNQPNGSAPQQGQQNGGQPAQTPAAPVGNPRTELVELLQDICVTLPSDQFQRLAAQYRQLNPKNRTAFGDKAKEKFATSGSPITGELLSAIAGDLLESQLAQPKPAEASKNATGGKDGKPAEANGQKSNNAQGAQANDQKPGGQPGGTPAKPPAKGFPVYTIGVALLVLIAAGIAAVQFGIIPLPSSGGGSAYDFNTPPPNFGAPGGTSQAQQEKEMAVSTLVGLCQDGSYFASLRSPAPEAVNNQTLCNDPYCKEKAAVPVPERMTYVIPMHGTYEGMLLVPVGLDAYYAPASFYPEVGGEPVRCLTSVEALGVDSRLNDLLPKQHMVAIHYTSPMFPVLVGLAVLALMFLVYELVVKNRLPVLVMAGIVLASYMPLQGYVEKSAPGQFLYFLGGLSAFLALGFVGDVLGQVRNVVQRAGDPNTPAELKGLVAKKGFWSWVLSWVEWSTLLWWICINAVLLAIAPQGAAFSYILDPGWSIAVLALLTVAVIILETLRRGSGSMKFMEVVVAVVIGAGIVAVPLMLLSLSAALGVAPNNLALYLSESVLCAVVAVLAILAGGKDAQNTKVADRSSDILATAYTLGFLGILAGSFFSWF